MHVGHTFRPFLALPLVGMLFLSACEKADSIASDAFESLESFASFGDSDSISNTEDFPIWSTDAQGEVMEIPAGDRHLHQALKSVVAQIQGHSTGQIWESFGVSLRRQNPYVDPALKDFYVARAVALEASGPDHTGRDRKLAGTIIFADDANRTAVVAYQMTISGNQQATLGPSIGQTIAIREAIVFPVYAEQPTVSLFVAPVATMEQQGASLVGNFERFQATAIDAALPINQSTALPIGEGDYLYMAFVRSQLAPGDRLQIEYVSRPDQQRGDRLNSYYRVYEGGWAVAMVRRTTNLTAEKGWIRLTLLPEKTGARSGNGPRTIGLFAAGAPDTALQRAQSSAKGE
ncbi:MAG: hypothetical protein AAF530_18220 [Pseudomonadota bacterium]